MEINKKFIYKNSIDNDIVNNKLVRPANGVAYVAETDKIYFNNVIIPQHSHTEPQIPIVS